MAKVFKIRDLGVEQIQKIQLLIAQNEGKIVSETDILHALIDHFSNDLKAAQIEETKNNSKKKLSNN